jgi:hypothetical protein
MENFSIEVGSDNEPPEEALWNGLFKVYTTQELDVFEPIEKTNQCVIGILQPFLPKREKASLYDYTLMTLAALVVGLRDGKTDGYCGSTLFDVEDAFPTYIDPPEGNSKNSVAATDLLYLAGDERTEQMLGEKEVLQLREIVKRWDIEEILGHLRRAFIDHADTIAENREEGANEEIFDDEGGASIILETPHPPHLVNGALNHWDISHNSNRLCLFNSQVEATRIRLVRARDFILTNKNFTPLDLVFAVDLWAKQLAGAIASSPTKSKTVREQGSVDPLGILAAGRCTPMNAELIGCVFTPPSSTVGEPSPQRDDQRTPFYGSFTEIPQSCFPEPPR